MSSLRGWVTAVTDPSAWPFPFCVREGERRRPRRNSQLKPEDGWGWGWGELQTKALAVVAAQEA